MVTTAKRVTIPESTHATALVCSRSRIISIIAIISGTLHRAINIKYSFVNK